MSSEWEDDAWEGKARETLAQLQFNSRPLIGALSRMAAERERAPRFVELVEAELAAETRHGAFSARFGAPGAFWARWPKWPKRPRPRCTRG